jgi:hypothetical protein
MDARLLAVRNVDVTDRHGTKSGTTLSSEIPPRQRADIKVSAIAGYDFDALGMVQVEDKTDLWTKTTEKFLFDKPCTLAGE